jgi:SAM-dependent methyltransferase
MGIWSEHLLPRLIDKACASSALAPMRARALAGLHGEVVEVGFGSGLNVPHYPPEVERVLAVEPSMVARRAAGPRIDAAGLDVRFVGIDGQEIPLADACADAIVSTFTLCTIPDPVAALGELRRLLRPGGQLRFVEHGLSPDPKVAAWQHRLTPIQRRVCGGCHLDRPITELVEAGGFTVDRVDAGVRLRPASFGYCFEGAGHPA